MKINTINVIASQTKYDVVPIIYSFPVTEQGEKEAAECFKKEARAFGAEDKFLDLFLSWNHFGNSDGVSVRIVASK